MEAFRDQAPQWAMALAITLICSSIVIERDSAGRFLGPSSTLSQLARKYGTASPEDSGQEATDAGPSKPTPGDRS